MSNTAKDIWDEAAHEAVIKGLSKALRRVEHINVSTNRSRIEAVADDVNSWIDFAIQVRDPKLHYEVKEEGHKFKIVNPRM